jgi:cytochrome c oxidase assembly protein subunit 15
MVLIGGLTRLTESGLSIAYWKPVSGMIPPISAEDWQHEFSIYQQSPEYQKKNLGMSLEEFKSIFWYEFIHRQWGRLTGMVVALPFLWLWARRKISASLLPGLGGIVLLVGLQGAMGWVMVKSGLVDNPQVSPFRLAAHLLLALTIFIIIFWHWLAVREAKGLRDEALAPARGGARLLWITSILLVAQIFWGALVAGHDAGLVFNSFPTMDGAWLPDDAWFMGWMSPFLHITTVQWVHRWNAVAVWLAACLLWWTGRKEGLPSRFRFMSEGFVVVVTAQFMVGVATLLGAVPIALASLHQMMALLVIALLVGMFYEKRVFRKEIGASCHV